MRGRRSGVLVCASLAVAATVGGACSQSAPPGETVASSRLPPFVPCYETDGAPCPLDAGDEGGDDAAAVDASDAGEAAVPDA